MENCIFCQIVEGNAPNYRVDENEKFLAILNTLPATRGHTLIIPKKHFETIFDLPEEMSKESFSFSKNVAEKLKTKLNYSGLNIFNSNGKSAQQEINHFHIHLIPRYGNENFEIKFEGNFEDKNFKNVLEEIGGKK